MPYVNIKVTRTGVTAEQKRQLIVGVTDLLTRVLDKPAAWTVVVVDEVETDNWGMAGETATDLIKRFRKPFDEHYFRRSLKSVRQGTWKFIWSSDGRHELFDLAADPGETSNVIDQAPERGRAMWAQLQAFLGALKPLAPAGEGRGGDA